MRAFVVVSFLLLALAYWQMSGGAGFVPEAWPETEVTAAEPAPGPSAAAAVVATRAEPLTDDLAALAPDPDPIGGAALPAEPLAAGEALAALAPDLAAESAPQEAAQAVAASAAVPDLRRVVGDLVNMRDGPGTGFGVVGRLAGGEVAEVLEAEGDWVRVRAPAGEGWMAARFLAPAG